MLLFSEEEKKINNSISLTTHLPPTHPPLLFFSSRKMFSILSSEENAKTKKKKKEKDKAYEAFLAKRSRGMKPLKMPILYFTEDRFQNTAKLDLVQTKFINWRMKERVSRPILFVVVFLFSCWR